MHAKKRLLKVITLTLLILGVILVSLTLYVEEIPTDLEKEYHDKPIVKKYVWKISNQNLYSLGIASIASGFIMGYLLIQTTNKAKAIKKASKKAEAK